MSGAYLPGCPCDRCNGLETDGLDGLIADRRHARRAYELKLQVRRDRDAVTRYWLNEILGRSA